MKLNQVLLIVKLVITENDIKNIKIFMEIDSIDSLTICCTWISVKGTKYQHKMVLTLDVNKNENSFLKFGIVDI